MQLTLQQQAVVFHEPATMAVYAAPGSGKTTVLTQHIIHLLQSRLIQPQQIWALTFTRKAANELRNRLHDAGGIARTVVEALHVGTFHAEMFALLLAHNPAIPRIMDTRQQIKMLTAAAQTEGLSPTARNLRSLQQLMAYAAVVADAPLRPVHKRIYRLYQAYKQRAHVWDFEDILVEAKKAFHSVGASALVPHGIAYILVDEYQDTNDIQYQILQQVVEETGAKLFVVGDDDPSLIVVKDRYKCAVWLF